PARRRRFLRDHPALAERPCGGHGRVRAEPGRRRARAGSGHRSGRQDPRRRPHAPDRRVGGADARPVDPPVILDRDRWLDLAAVPPACSSPLSEAPLIASASPRLAPPTPAVVLDAPTTPPVAAPSSPAPLADACASDADCGYDPARDRCSADPRANPQ